jgi:hypothetical protein
MLGQIRQSVFPPNQPVLPWMSSVHFILKDGAVRIVGTVPTAADRQRIETMVQQTPGVVRVYDVLSVNASAGAPTGNASVNGNASINGNPAANATIANRNSFAPTNIGDSVPPSSRFTNIVYGTAPVSNPQANPKSNQGQTPAPAPTQPNP